MRLIIPALALLLAACAAPVTGGPRATYQCEDGTVLEVRFAPEIALVTAGPGGELRLPQQPSGSGFWYSSGRHELRGKGDEATWTVGRRAPTACKAKT